MRTSTSRQAQGESGFELSAFIIDFQQRQAICPAGHTSSRWFEETSRGTPLIRVAFRKVDCGPCPLPPQCTTAKIGLRQLTLRSQPQHEALELARREQRTEEWKARYKVRAGVEGTISQAVDLDVRRTRYIGLAKTHLGHVLTASAMNMVRLDAWLTETPLRTTRISHFTRLELQLTA